MIEHIHQCKEFVSNMHMLHQPEIPGIPAYILMLHTTTFHQLFLT